MHCERLLAIMKISKTVKKGILKKVVILMPTNEKEYNGYLLDQLELIERLELVIEKNDMEALKMQLALEKKFVERKLYQKPPLVENQ